MDDIAGLRAGGMADSVVPGQQRHGTAPHTADPDIIIAVHVQAPRDVKRLAGVAHRRGLGSVGTDHVDGTGGSGRRPHDILEHGLSNELELLDM